MRILEVIDSRNRKRIVSDGCFGKNAIQLIDHFVNMQDLFKGSVDELGVF